MKLTRETLREIGEALFGPSWQTPLAEALISDRTGRSLDLRTVQRWANGEFKVPDTPHIRNQLAALCRANSKNLVSLAKKLDSGKT